jgi:hypothetical protein
MEAVLALSPQGEVTTLRASDLGSATGRRYVVAVPRQAGPFAAELAERGVDVVALDAPGPAPTVGAQGRVAQQGARLQIRLPRGVETDAVLDAALALDLPILHLAPAEVTPDNGERRHEKC